MKRCNLDELVRARLFNSAASWPMDPSEIANIDRTFEILGLVERVSGDLDCWRNTPLGNAINLDLLMVFLGIWDEYEVPQVLRDNGLIDEWEYEHLWVLLGGGCDYATLRPAVRRAYSRAMNKGVIRWRMN